MNFIGRFLCFTFISLFAIWLIGAFSQLDPWFWTNPNGDVGRAWAAIVSLVMGLWLALYPGFDK